MALAWPKCAARWRGLFPAPSGKLGEAGVWFLLGWHSSVISSAWPCMAARHTGDAPWTSRDAGPTSVDCIHQWIASRSFSMIACQMSSDGAYASCDGRMYLGRAGCWGC